MEQTAAPPPPPTAVTAATTTAHPASLDSSPRSRTTDSWIEDCSLQPPGSTTAAAAAATGGLTKLRLMCSYGGHIVPRPHDKSMCYVGGDTRIVVVDRRITLSDLTLRLAKTLLRSSSTFSGTSSFTIKYQLPSEDLDSLISVTTDEDLENMIDEYDRLNVNSSSDCNKSSRIRLFLFPTKPESVTSIGSLLESSVKSEDWFLNALNGTLSGLSDTSSVNCLLGLEDDVSVQEKKDVNQNHKGVICKNFQDVQSVPDSPMLETTSSFGSASSSPSLANLPPVTVHVEDQPKVAGGIEEQFSKLSVQQQVKQKDDVNFVAETAPVVVSGVPIGSKVPITENPNPNPNPKSVLSEDEKSEQCFQMAHQIHQQQHQPDSISSDGSINNSPSGRKPPVNILDQNTRIQVQQQVQDSAYILSTPTARMDQQTHQSHHQPQFIHTAVPPPQYLPHHPSRAVPMPPFYQIYPSQTQQSYVYYMPARQQPQGYTLPLQADAPSAVSAPPNNQVPPPSGLFTVPRDVQSATKTEPPPGVYRTTTNSGAPAPQLVQIPYSQQQILPQFLGYSHIHQPTQPVPSSGGGSYVYEFTDPSQKGQYIYSPAQPLPPQSAAQHPTMTSNIPVEAQATSMNQQVRTSQP